MTLKTPTRACAEKNHAPAPPRVGINRPCHGERRSRIPRGERQRNPSLMFRMIGLLGFHDRIGPSPAHGQLQRTHGDSDDDQSQDAGQDIPSSATDQKPHQQEPYLEPCFAEQSNRLDPAVGVRIDPAMKHPGNGLLIESPPRYEAPANSASTMPKDARLRQGLSGLKDDSHDVIAPPCIEIEPGLRASCPWSN